MQFWKRHPATAAGETPNVKIRKHRRRKKGKHMAALVLHPRTGDLDWKSYACIPQRCNLQYSAKLQMSFQPAVRLWFSKVTMVSSMRPISQHYKQLEPSKNIICSVGVCSSTSPSLFIARTSTPSAFSYPTPSKYPSNGLSTPGLTKLQVSAVL